MKRIVTKKPGVLIGLSVERLYKNKKAYFFDGEDKLLEIELEKVYEETKRNTGFLPGYELEQPLFFSKNLTIICDYDVDIDPFYS